MDRLITVVIIFGIVSLLVLAAPMVIGALVWRKRHSFASTIISNIILGAMLGFFIAPSAICASFWAFTFTGLARNLDAVVSAAEILLVVAIPILTILGAIATPITANAILHLRNQTSSIQIAVLIGGTEGVLALAAFILFWRWAG